MIPAPLPPTAAGRVRHALAQAADHLDEAEKVLSFAKHSADLVSPECYAEVERLRRQFDATRCLLDAEVHGPKLRAA